jgi:ATP-dependent Clp protease ATP-binding subunit ClpX
MPYIRINAKDVTMSGYVGKSIEDVMTDYVKAFENSDMAENIPYGLIHIDEFDKICSVASDSSDKTGSWMTHQQQIWLSCIEGIEYHLNDARNPVKPAFRRFKTDNLLIVVSGSFAQLQELLDEKEKASSYKIGFSSHLEEKEQEQTIQEKFMEGGMIRELAGRFSLIAEIYALERDQLIAIAKTPNSVFDQYSSLLEDVGVDIGDALIEEVIDAAIAAKTGARGLQAAIEQRIVDKLFNIDFNFSKELNEPLKEID